MSSLPGVPTSGNKRGVRRKCVLLGRSHYRPSKEGHRFYSQLFGWETEVGKNDPSGYLHILNRGNYISGIPPVREGQEPPHWLIYYQVSGIETATERANSNGGKIYQPPFSVPDTGKIAVLADPQGAVFALFEPSRSS
jgi:predicted enzyme related to lactoylglutathione lyase